MKLTIFAIKDTAANMYLKPIFEPHAAIVLRQLQDELQRNEPNNTLRNHAQDFALWKIGEFDTETGDIKATPHEKIIDLNILKGE